jgi:AAA family ATP:ADP antiporter
VIGRLVGWFVDLEDDDELKGMLWAAVYGFLIMLASYVLRAVRDEISAEDRGNLQILWTVVFFVMVFCVP